MRAMRMIEYALVPPGCGVVWRVGVFLYCICTHCTLYVLQCVSLCIRFFFLFLLHYKLGLLYTDIVLYEVLLQSGARVVVPERPIGELGVVWLIGVHAHLMTRGKGWHARVVRIHVDSVGVVVRVGRTAVVGR